MKVTVAVVLLFLLATRAPAAVVAVPECDLAGELDIYEMETENATIAKCEYRNASEQLTKQVFYRQRRLAGPRPWPWPGGPFLRTLIQSSRPPFHRSELVPYLIRVFQYDDQGRRVRAEEYSLGRELLSYDLTEYRADGSRVLSSFTSDGIKTTETWRTEAGDRTVVRFDKEGQRPVAIRGLLLSARNLSGGWGKPVAGISCAVTASTLHGTIDQMRVYASLRNLSDRRLIVPVRSEYLRLELRDKTDQVVSQQSAYVERQTAARARDKRDPVSFGRTEIRPGHAEFWGGDIGLEKVYGDIPPGTYALTVAREIPELMDPIACGTLQITVAAQSALK